MGKNLDETKSYQDVWVRGKDMPAWNDVFSAIGENSYNKCVSNNEKDAENVTERHFQTLGACVQAALKTGNHVAFARYLLQEKYNYRNRFRDLLDFYIANYQKATSFKLPAWSNLRIFKNIFWTSPDLEFSRGIADKDCFFLVPATLSNLRYLYTTPKRETLVQAGIYLRLTCEQVDELLILAGLERLYPLTIADLAAKYHLDLLAQIPYAPGLTIREEMISRYREGKLQGEDSLNVMERLKIVKDDINAMTAAVISQDSEGIYHKIAKDEEGNPVRWVQYASNGSLAEEFDVRFEDLKSKMKIPGTEKEMDLARRVEDAVEKAVEDAQRQRTGVLCLLDRFEATWFNNGRYGFLYKCVDAFTELRYRKNLYYSNWNLTAKGGGSFDSPVSGSMLVKAEDTLKNADELKTRLAKLHRERLEQSGFSETLDFWPINSQEAELYWKLFEIGVQFVDAIWKIPDMIFPPSYPSENRKVTLASYDNRLTAKNILAGRPPEPKEIAPKMDTTREVYVPKVQHKRDLLRYLIAMGKEDSIFSAMNLAGYWELKLYFSQWEEGKEPDLWADHDGIWVDRTDALILYALAYRDGLIDSWTRLLKNPADRRVRKNILRRDFPFIKLLMLIARDVQFIAAEDSISPSLSAWNDKDYQNLKKDLLFPVTEKGEGFNGWFGKYKGGRKAKDDE